jgi:pimeloyl-ACP methyl ester carboxylesterase
MDDEDWIVADEGVRGEWLSSPDAGVGAHPPVLFVPDPLTDPADARAVAMELVQLGCRVLWVDTGSMSIPESAPADGADAVWEREEGYPDRPAVRELGQLAEAMGTERPAVVGVGLGATWALLLGCQSVGVSAVAVVNGRLVYPRLSVTKPVQPLEMILNLSAPVLLIDGSEGEGVAGEQIDLALDRFAAFGIEVEVERISPSRSADAGSALRVAERLRLFLSSVPRQET